MFRLKSGISPNRQFYLVAGFSLLILLVSISLALYTISNTNKSIVSLDRSYEINIRLERILALIKDAETGQRGYIITDQVAFLSPYYSMQEKAGREFGSLYHILKEDIEQKSNLNALKVMLDKKFDILNQVKKYFNQEGIINDSLRTLMIAGEVAKEDIQYMIKNINEIESGRLQTIKSETFNNSRLSIYIITLTCSLSFLLLINVLIILNNEYYRKTAIEKNLTASRHLLENEVHKLNLSNKELEQFAYVASHDLQEPLRKIIAFSERIEDRLIGMKDEEVTNYLEKLKQSTSRMRTLIKDLLDYSRATRVLDTDEQVNLNSTFKMIAEDLEVVISSKKATIEIDKLKTVKGNNTQLRQLFQNLLSNALKFNNARGPLVRVWASIYTWEEIKVANWGNGFNLRKGNYYCLFVKDNGIGFEPFYLDQIFVIFQRLHGRSEYEGSGIGLAICKRIIENHKGFITAESKLEQGTTFIVGLPT